MLQFADTLYCFYYVSLKFLYDHEDYKLIGLLLTKMW